MIKLTQATGKQRWPAKIQNTKHIKRVGSRRRCGNPLSNNARPSAVLAPSQRRHGEHDRDNTCTAIGVWYQPFTLSPHSSPTGLLVKRSPAAAAQRIPQKKNQLGLPPYSVLEMRVIGRNPCYRIGSLRRTGYRFEVRTRAAALDRRG